MTKQHRTTLNVHVLPTAQPQVLYLSNDEVYAVVACYQCRNILVDGTGQCQSTVKASVEHPIAVTSNNLASNRTSAGKVGDDPARVAVQVQQKR